MRPKIFSESGGFTLIELMLVIAIISILANVALFFAGAIVCKARDGKRKSDLQTLAIAIELYHIDQGTYIIPGTGALGLGLGGNVNQGNGEVVSGTVAYPGLPITVVLAQMGYLKSAPLCDPSDYPPCYQNYLQNYYYTVCGNDSIFSVSTTLERPSAADLAHVSVACGASNGATADAANWIFIDDPIKGKNYAIP